MQVTTRAPTTTHSSASSRCERPEIRAPTLRPRDRLLPAAAAAAVQVAAGAQAVEVAAEAAAAASAGRAEAIPWGTVYQPPAEMPPRLYVYDGPGVSSPFVVPSTPHARQVPGRSAAIDGGSVSGLACRSPGPARSTRANRVVGASLAELAAKVT